MDLSDINLYIWILYNTFMYYVFIIIYYLFPENGYLTYIMLNISFILYHLLTMMNNMLIFISSANYVTWDDFDNLIYIEQ
jgi:hypothetical protein